MKLVKFVRNSLNGVSAAIIETETENYKAYLIDDVGSRYLGSFAHISAVETYIQSVCANSTHEDREIPLIAPKFHISKRLCADILTTCMEGGSNNWGRFSTLHTYKDEGGETPCAALVVDCECSDVPAFKPRVVTASVIRGGLLAAVQTNAPSHQELALQVFRALHTDDASHLDANACDLILQIALFNKIVFA